MSSSVFGRFPAREYVSHYYSYVGDENAAMLDAMLDSVAVLKPTMGRVVEAGGGPSLVPLIALTAGQRPAREVVFADVAPSNLTEVQAWLDHEKNAFDYRAVLEWIAQRTGKAADEIERGLRASSWTIERVDLLEALPKTMLGGFDTVSSHFFAESATDEEDEFVFLLSQIQSLGAPGAAIFMSFMRRSLGYSVAGIRFPALDVDEETLPGYFDRAGFKMTEVTWRTTPVEDPPTREGYQGMVFLSGRLAT